MAVSEVNNPTRVRQIAEIVALAFKPEKQRELAEKYGLLDQLPELTRASVKLTMSPQDRKIMEENERKTREFKLQEELRNKRRNR
ncbi:MAG TPA: hypothetical protein VLH19_01405 [Patescibacteria group bacterium]|nr:hypothetical protein [Patescibacteria group bacterium]